MRHQFDFLHFQIVDSLTSCVRTSIVMNIAETSSFCWLRFILKNQNSWLTFYFGLIWINPYRHCLMHKVYTRIQFFQNFFAPFETSFFELRSNCAVSNEHTDFFTAKCLYKIVYVWLLPMPTDASISLQVTRRSVSIILRTASMFSGMTALGGRPSRNSLLTTPRLNSVN